MPVVQVSDGVPLCLLGKCSRIALNLNRVSSCHSFDFEAETIDTRIVAARDGSPSATGAVPNRQGAPQDAVPRRLLPRSGSDPMGRP